MVAKASQTCRNRVLKLSHFDYRIHATSVKMGSISTLVPKFELKEAESIASSVKMTIFPPNFDTKSVKIGRIWSKWGPFQHWYQNSN